MKYDEFNEIVNGDATYRAIAEELLEKKSVLIGWTDQVYDHRDILFTLSPVRHGNIQRGLKGRGYLYVSIIDISSMGFMLSGNPDNVYIREKLRLDDSHCDNMICELIINVVKCLNKVEQFRTPLNSSERVRKDMKG